MNPFNLRTTAEEKAYWDYVENVTKLAETVWAKRIRKVLNGQMKRVLSYIDGKPPVLMAAAVGNAVIGSLSSIYRLSARRLSSPCAGLRGLHLVQ